MILNTEVLWNKALTDNNVRGIICWLRGLYTDGEEDMDERLASFDCWLQRSAELTKKELLMCCFSQCRGLWMFLDENSFAVIHKLVLKLKNLLSLFHLVKKHSSPLHIKHGMPCGECALGSKASYGWDYWNQNHYAIRQHILLGRLVQWWGMAGLLPKYPEAHELKRISQMWREMDQKHRRTCLELGCYTDDKYRCSSLIHGMVAHMDKQHGPIWVSEECAYQTYPPPSLQAMLKLVLMPNIDIESAQAIIMYFVLDISNSLQCKDDLLQSFCDAFTIPSIFSQQIYGFWLLDHELVSDSMNILLSPRACPPPLSWHHCAVLRTLLRRGENRQALKYLYSIKPTMESIHDIKLCMDVLIQNNCVCEAWALLKRLQTGNDHLFKHFLHGCANRGICRDMLATLCKGMTHLCLIESQNMESNKADILNQETLGQQLTEPGQIPRPLSALLYQSAVDDPLSPGDFISILRKSVSEICPPPKLKREVVVLPKYLRRSVNSIELPLSSQALHHIKSPSLDIHFKKQAEEEVYEEGLPLMPEEHCQTVLAVSKLLTRDTTIFTQNEEIFESLPVFSPDSMESTGSFFFTCSSPPAVEFDAPPTKETILLLQKSHAVLDDGKSQIPDDDKIQTPVDMVPCCSDLTLTVEGATEAVSINILSREIVGGTEEILTIAIPADISHTFEGDTVEAAQAEKRLMGSLNLHPNFYSNEDNQSVSSVPVIPAENHNFLSPNHEKFVYHKIVPDVVTIKPENLTEGRISSLNEQKAEFVHLQESVSASGSSSFLELKPLRQALSLSRAEESLQGPCRDSEDAIDQPEILTSCALTDTMHDLLAHLHQADLLADVGEPYQPCSSTILKQSIMEMDLSHIHRSPQSHKLQTPIGSSLFSRSGPTQPLNLSQQSRHRSSSESRVTATNEAMCFRSTSDRVGHCKLGSWWKQALETRRASTGLLPALEQVSPVTQEKQTSPGPRSPQRHGLIRFLDLPTSSRVEKQEAVKNELSGRRGSFNLNTNQMEHRSTSHRGRRGKTGKRIK
ncbi:uncharacterized protein LOC127411215 [Myxocyprinus asiaticus]|uniref:uncharacterized protein LOC127411215 n=1 Tax=Myxocyprinus asiaticus TaxID=70543 RepID=UPI002222DCDD|nr:uncharacterized protein LOC127411215 [Myxocyprinus asiaticus]